MFDFAYPRNLLSLAAVIVAVILFWYAQASRKRNLKRFGNMESLSPLMPDASKYMPRVKFLFLALALAAISMILARPRAGEAEPQQSTTEGIEIVIAFDVSNSMLASSTDNPDGISRLDRARLLLEKLIDRLDNDKVGLVVYAAQAKTQMPLTVDYFTAKMYLSELSPKMVSAQGTSITDAINMAVSCFTPNDSIPKAIILITDAENHEGDAVEAAKQAARVGIQVDVVGVGTQKGMPIMLGNNDYMLDRDGQVVLTSFNEDLAKQIAEAGNGIYVNGASSSALDDLANKLDKLGTAQFSGVRYKTSAEQFPTFAWIALILLVIDCFIVERKISWLKGINFFSR